MRLRKTSLAFTILTSVGASVLALQSHDAKGAWPPGPNTDMTNPANWPNDPNYNGLWTIFSFLPQQEADAGVAPYLSADTMLGASGSSADVAWKTTIGLPSVIIASIDCGVKWDETDLIDQIALNAAELKNHKPMNADSSACGGSGALAGYDCNADGVFSVADYLNDPRITGTVSGETCFNGADPTQPGGDRMTGDLNRNCVIDAGDLIELFSDNVDDDANGYTDDIAGWDFFKSDNNPYDDTRYGHGTGQLEDSAAAANNMIKGVGTCPGCRVLPIRQGDSFVGDANDFALGAIYAVDNGASVIQESLGTVDQTALSRAAIDYAYAKGVPVIASMADEDARHHNMPATANHTLPAHSIRAQNGTNDSDTFLDFNTCTNYGAQGAISTSSLDCASEATGRSAGIAGLVVSAGRKANLSPALDAEEVFQLMKMNADDVNVMESRSTDPSVAINYYESLPGWDQRFNYGRTNAAKSVAAVTAGQIPPHVEITSPDWFEPVFADRSGTIAIMGSISAPRANAYDYVVEWAAGVEPADSAFTTITSMSNVPGANVVGGTTPLATIDPTMIDTSHTPDPDSKHHENDRTVTLRVRATAHYTGFDVKGDARRAIAITNAKNGLDTDLLPGFPIKITGSGEAGPKLADIDGDGVREIVYATSEGSLHVWTLKSGMPVELTGFPYRTQLVDGLNPLANDPTLPSYTNATAFKNGSANGRVDPSLAHEAIVGAPGVADLDGDGTPEIVFTTYDGTIYVIDHTGHDVTGWPKRLPDSPSCPLNPANTAPANCSDTAHIWARGSASAPVLVDFDGDKKLEIVQAGFDGKIYIFHHDGTPLTGWPVLVHSASADAANRIATTPAVADLNGDGIPDLVSGSNEQFQTNTGAFYAIDGRGTTLSAAPYLPDWPIKIGAIHIFPLVGEGTGASPALADFDNDGKLDVAIQGTGSLPFLLKADPGMQVVTNAPPNRLPVNGSTLGLDALSKFGAQTDAFPDSFLPFLSQPSIGDMDQDGVPDIVMPGGSSSEFVIVGKGGVRNAPYQNLLAMWSGKTGKMLPGSPMVVEDFVFLEGASIADINGDNYPEAILGTASYFVHAFDGCGREPTGWPKFVDGWVSAQPAVGDIDGDAKHTLEVVTGTREGYIFAWHTTGTQDGVVGWESYHHDNANTGNFGAKLDQGSTTLATTPLVCPVIAPDAGVSDASTDAAGTNDAEATTPPGNVSGGGCSCDLASNGATNRTGIAGAFALLGLVVARRRRGSKIVG